MVISMVETLIISIKMVILTNILNRKGEL